jgi:prepilin-type processing-associated H-X9-DG protein
MRGRIQIVVLTLVVITAGGLLLAYFSRVRDKEAQQRCRDNLRTLGFGLENHATTYFQRYPPGTVANEALPPERRLSWLVGEWGFVGDCQLVLLLDGTAGWDEEVNREPRLQIVNEPDERKRVFAVRDWSGFVCPSNPARAAPGSPGLTHYVGIAGVGLDAAARRIGYPGVGVFGHDRRTRKEDILDGLATTLLMVETSWENGPWTAGGPPTVRSLNPADVSYLGEGGQFASSHRSSGWLGSFRTTNALFADGSVRAMRETISPEVFRALATIAGGEEVGALPEQ